MKKVMIKLTISKLTDALRAAASFYLNAGSYSSEDALGLSDVQIAVRAVRSKEMENVEKMVLSAIDQYASEQQWPSAKQFVEQLADRCVGKVFKVDPKYYDEEGEYKLRWSDAIQRAPGGCARDQKSIDAIKAIVDYVSEAESELERLDVLMAQGHISYAGYQSEYERMQNIYELTFNDCRVIRYVYDYVSASNTILSLGDNTYPKIVQAFLEADGYSSAEDSIAATMKLMAEDSIAVTRKLMKKSMRTLKAIECCPLNKFMPSGWRMGCQKEGEFLSKIVSTAKTPGLF